MSSSQGCFFFLVYLEHFTASSASEAEMCDLLLHWLRQDLLFCCFHLIYFLIVTRLTATVQKA